MEDSDEHLLQAVQRGDKNAIGTLVNRHHSRLIGYLYRLSGGDRTLAEDLAQESFVRLISTVARYEYPRPVKPYLYQIATNLARDHFKSAHVQRDAPLEAVETRACYADHAPDTLEDSLWTTQTLHRAAAALQCLPAPQREAVVLRYYQELSLQEIADALGIPVGTAKSRVSLGLKRLREILETETDYG